MEVRSRHALLIHALLEVGVAKADSSKVRPCLPHRRDCAPTAMLAPRVHARSCALAGWLLPLPAAPRSRGSRPVHAPAAVQHAQPGTEVLACSHLTTRLAMSVDCHNMHHPRLLHALPLPL